MKLRFECRKRGCPALIEYRPLGTGDETLNCPRCGEHYTVRHSDRLARGEPLERCALCGGMELYIRKNFPQRTGLLIVVIAAALSFMTLQRTPALAYGVLAGAVLIDLAIYCVIGLVTVCYRCRAQYWGLARNRRHDWFDLATSEKYL